MLCDIVTIKNYKLDQLTFARKNLHKVNNLSRGCREFKGESRGFGVLKMQNIKNLNIASFWNDYAGSEVSFAFSCLKLFLLMIFN